MPLPPRRRIHVVMVSGHAPPVIDGVADYTASLLDELSRARPNWRWTWISRRPRWFHSPILSCDRYRIFRPAHTWNGAGPRLASATLRALKPDILHVQEQIHSYFETDAAVQLADAAGCPVVTTLHEYHLELPSAVHTTELLRRSTRVIASDARNAERCRSEAGIEPHAQLWSGSSVPTLDPSARPPIRPGLVGTFGFLNGLKSLGIVREALVRLRQSGRHDVRWRLVGPFHPESNPGHAELACESDPGWVEFTGEIANGDPRLGRLLTESNVMALPYLDGASPRRTTLHAAWSLGVPVVTTPPTHDEPSIVDGENCLLVREPTPEAWAASIGRVLGDGRLAARLRRGSSESAARYSWSELGRRHLGLYDEMLGSSG